MTVSDRGRRACFAPGGTPIIATVRKQRSHDAWGDHESSTVRAAAAGGQARQLSRKLTKNRKLAIKRQLLRIVLVQRRDNNSVDMGLLRGREELRMKRDATPITPKAVLTLQGPVPTIAHPPPTHRPSDTDLIVRPRYGTLPRTTSGHVPHAHTARQRYIQHNFYTAHLIPRTVLYANCTLLRWCGGITSAYFAAYSLLHLLITAAYSALHSAIQCIIEGSAPFHRHHHAPSSPHSFPQPFLNPEPPDMPSAIPAGSASPAIGGAGNANDNIRRFVAPSRPLSPRAEHALFHNKTRCFVYGLQPRAVQGMLDFDFICKRSTPSVAGIIYTFGGQFVSKMYWGTSETLLPVYQSVDKAMAKHSDVDTVVNFASSRSVYQSTMELMEYPQIRSIAIIAEGVPERRAREILHVAAKKGITIIGPATVGGIKPGAFKIGNTGGMMDNIVASKLYRPGSVGYVSKSGGMSNELNNIICNTTDGVYEGVAIGGDRYPGTTFIDHLLRYQADPDCKILLLLGEVGGIEEYRVIEAVQDGTITKPIVAWAIGTCASMFKTEVQFGHAGSFANSQLETAANKNKAMKEAGFYVPDTFEDMPALLSSVYQTLVKAGSIKPKAEPIVPKIPLDYSWAQELGLIRKPAAFISTISDDRGQELLYAGMPISDVFREDIGIGGVMSLLWFRRRLPDYASKFLEMVLMLTADHGPAVSGAMNTIITTRAGKDLISALVSGLLTIGSRFGGALDGAAEEFTRAYDKGLSPRDFVDTMRKQNKLIPGIGHKVKSRNNPDLRVELVKEFVKKRFPSCKMLDYALAVESVTTSKKDNLILNVDGAVAVCFVDLMRNCGAFSAEEAEDYLKMGVLNGLFVLGRSIGLIAHYLDQKRLRTGLYRHPWDDITYLLPTLQSGAPGSEGRVEVQM
ncbi:hypothetical protein V496_05016 [Pseudogymnoascus sp. VKM F-4515 (FW-2607)]|nr:hypothetical protein V496_05016 [Pseudogymnoascus sp. VKM F-4515 (FW-2607)]